MSFNALDISASALHAQRIKMDTVSSNIANVNTTRNADGTVGPYRRKEAIFSAVYGDTLNPNQANTSSMGVGVNSEMLLKGNISMNQDYNTATGVKIDQITEDQSPFKKVYDPSHPDADKDGYVSLPNVNVVKEMVDMMNASKAYEANLTCIDTTKGMLASAMKI